MRELLRQYLTGGDIVVIGLVLILGAGSAVYIWSGPPAGGEATHVHVRSLDRQRSEPLLRVELPAEERHQIPGSDGTLYVEISGSRARVVEADCPDQICVHTGWLSRPGSRSICVPRKIVVELIGDEKEEYDQIIQ